MKKTLPFLMLLSLFLTACKKNNSDTPTPAVPRYLLSLAVLYDPGVANDSTFYSYDNKNRLIDIRNGTLTSFEESKLIYNNNDQVTEYDLFQQKILVQKAIFTYTGNYVLEHRQLYNVTTGNFVTTDDDTLLLNSSKKVTQINFGNLTRYTYEYDSRGNVSYYTYTGPGLTNPLTVTYNHDSYNSPLSAVNGNYYLVLLNNDLVNNCIAETSPYQPGGPGTAITYEHGSSGYTYKSAGYAITAIPTNMYLPGVITKYTYIVGN